MLGWQDQDVGFGGWQEEVGDIIPQSGGGNLFTGNGGNMPKW